MAENQIGRNIAFKIYNADGTEFEGLVMYKSTFETVVMSLGDKITGDVYYKDNGLSVTMQEYIVYNGVKYILVNPPTILREGMVSDNSELKGMTKYSFVFYHPMYQLSNIPFTDVAVTQSQEAYLSENRSFSWIGTPNDFIAKLNTNLNGTQWTVVKSSRFPSELENKLSEVLSFDNAMIADALKTWYDTWGIPYVIDQVASTESSYAHGKRFKVVMGLPSNEIYESAEEQQLDNPFVFEMGKGVGLKNNSRTPRNNKIITRIAGYGSERNIPYGYPQIVWTGDEDDSRLQYPLYDGIVGGQAVKLIKHPFTRSHLMPSVYSERVNKKVNPNATGYNPNITLIDYYDATGATYPNNINPLAPSYDVHEFEDIYPELGSAAIVSATPLNPDLTPAEAWDDTMDDDGNYVQSYFSVALPQLSFDLYACAAITESMELNMRSGACLGCTFPVQVDWDEYKKNFYHDDGTFDPVPHTQDGDGHVRDITKFPKSDSGSITIILQKETQTFGTLMPNVYQYPQSGDNFVILGISLPLSYITNAESRLDTAMTSYMLENNVYYYDYPLKFDEHFLATHTYILQQIRPNTVVNFKFAGDTLSLFVKQLTVKYGEKVLPQYDITLTDNVDVVLNQIGRVAEDVEKLSTLIAILRQNYGSSVWAEIAKKLSKTNDDTAQGFIRFMRGLQVGAQYVPDILGTGGVFRTGSDGKTELVTDTLYVRMRAYFDSVVIREYRHESGNRIASPAQGFNCSRVEWIKVVNGEETVLEQTSANINNVDYFRCYWRVDDGEQKTDNQFIVGDLAFCENSTVSNNSLSTKRYWRVVVGRNNGNETTENGEAWIDVSNAHDANGNPVMTTISYAGQGGTTETLSVLSFESGSDVPSAHDDICMLGCVRDETRQGAIVEYASGVDAPTYQIFQGIGEDATNPYVLLNKNMITVGYNTSTGRAMMNVYGDAYIGDPNGTTFLKYEQENSTTHAPKLTIKADVEFQNPLVPSQDTTLDAFAQAMVQSINGLQEQIDGEIDTWFYEGTPTLSNSPAVDWTTDTLKERHLGDLYYDIGTGATAGFAYRFIKSTVGGTTTYSWQYLEDMAITEALTMAAHAQDTADHKRRVFLQQPTPPYDAGDLWANATYPSGNTVTDESQHKYYNDLLKCITSKSTGSFSINDWALASKYTDDAAFNAFFANTYTPFVTNIQGQVDEKAETWYQDDDPSTAWTTDALKESHVGDIWCDTSTDGGKKTYIWQNFGTSESPRYAWGEQAVPDEVFDKIDGKAAIYVNNPNNPPTNYHANDLWILPIDATINSVAYKQGEILTATTDSVTYNQAHWVKKVCYTDDTRLNNFISQILNGSGTTGNDAVVANAIRAVNSALNENTTDISGGLVLTSLIGMRQGSTVWAGISGQYDSTPESQGGAKGHGIAAWYGGGMIDHEESPSTSGYAKSLFRFDGSGYLAGGNITWDDNGIVTIANVYANIGGTDTSLTGTLQTLTNLSNALPLTLQSGVTYLDPQYSFTANLSVLGNPVATQAWVGQNYVSIAFFNRLFQAYKSSTITDANKVIPNDVQTTINNLKIMVGAWTEQYLSALGKSDSGGEIVLNEPLASINNAGLAAHPSSSGQTIVWNGSAWTYGTAGGSGMTYTFDTGDANGQFKVTPSSGAAYNVSIKGLAALAYKASLAVSDIPDLSGTYLPLSAGSNKPLTGSLYLSSLGKGIFAPYTVGGSTVNIPLIYDNGEDLWIGATQTAGTHHVGATHISAGTGEVYISRLVSSTRTNYKVLDKGNTYVSSGNGYIDGSEITTISGNAGTASRLQGSGTCTAWGRTYWQNGQPQTVSGLISDASGLKLNSTGSTYGYIDFHYASASSYTSNIYEVESGILRINHVLYVDNNNSNVGVGIQTPGNYKLNVSGTTYLSGLLTAYGNIQTSANNGAYIQIGAMRLIYDSQNSALKVVKMNGSTEEAGNFYATGGVSALGMSDDSSASTFDESAMWEALRGQPTAGVINNQYIPALSGLRGVSISSLSAGQTLVYRNGNWVNETIAVSTTIAGASDFSTYFTGTKAKDSDKLNGQYASYYAKASDVTTLQGYFNNGSAKTAEKLKTAVSLWGNSFDGSTDLTNSLTINNGSGISIKDNTGTARQVLAVDSNNNCYLGDGLNVLTATLSGKSVNIRYNGTTSGIFLNTSGNVGIGTTSPAYKLDVSGTGYFSGVVTARALVLNKGIGGSDSYGYIDFYYGGGTTLTSNIYEQESGKLNINGSLYVIKNGNVGIGYSTPGTYKLYVNGTSYFADNSRFDECVGIGAAANNSYRLYVAQGNNTTYGLYINGKSYLNGFTGIGTAPDANSIYRLKVAGTSYLEGAVIPSPNTLTIGGAVLEWDETNSALKVRGTTSTTAPVNFYSTGGVSALGIGSDGTSGGGVALNAILTQINNTNLTEASSYDTALVYQNGWKKVVLGSLAFQTADIGDYIVANEACQTITVNGSSYAVANGNINLGSNFVVHKEVGQDDLTAQSGSFFFGGTYNLAASEDYVGFQAGNNADRWQMAYFNGQLRWRENDNPNAPASGWTEWYVLLHSGNYTNYFGNYIPKSGASDLSGAFLPSSDQGAYLGNENKRFMSGYFYGLSANEFEMWPNGYSGKVTTFLPDSDGNLIITPYSELRCNGGLTLKASQYINNNVFGLNVNNSDIIGLNGMYFFDYANNASEGINFVRSDGEWNDTNDALYAQDGNLLFETDIDYTTSSNGAKFRIPLSGPFVKSNGTNYKNRWRKVGTYEFAGSGAQQIVIELFSGNGYNGNPEQNSNAKITIKHGYQTSANQVASKSVGVTCERYGYSCQMQVAVKGTTYYKGEVWILVPVDYGNGFYRISGDYAKWTHNTSAAETSQTTSPHNQVKSDGTANQVLYFDYLSSTDTYISGRTIYIGGSSISVPSSAVSLNGVLTQINNTTIASTTASNSILVYQSGWKTKQLGSAAFSDNSAFVAPVDLEDYAKLDVLSDYLSKTGGELSGNVLAKKSSGDVNICVQSNNKKVGLDVESNRGVYDWNNGSNKKWLIGTNSSGTGVSTAFSTFVVNVAPGSISDTHTAFNLYVNGKAKFASSAGESLTIGTSTTYTCISYLQSAANWSVGCNSGGSFYWWNNKYTSNNGVVMNLTNQGVLSVKGTNVTSDINLKNVDENITLDLEVIARSPLFRFTWKEGNDGIHIGTSAQYWQKNYNEFVAQGIGGHLGLDYAGTALAAAISVARKTLTHEEEIKRLKAKVAELETEVEQLKAA